MKALYRAFISRVHFPGQKDDEVLNISEILWEWQMTDIYSTDDIRNTYRVLRDHVHTRDIIRGHAMNPRDIREVALENLDLSRVKRVLDLGCGYGFFTEGLKGRLHAEARIFGIDAVDAENREIFLKTVERIGYQGEFIHSRADFLREMDEGCFDLVTASYSLYFFPHIIEEIARVLKPEGLFITVTHSRESLKEVTRYIPRCLEKIGIDQVGEIAFNLLLQSFSLENGEEKLKPFFGKVERIVYENDLLFSLQNIQECFDYLEKKRFLIFKDVSDKCPQKMKDMLSELNMMIREHARLNGKIAVTKDDAVFRCFCPRRR